MSLARCRVVLVRTHFPGNLGAAARAMRNFGLTDLALVAPLADPLAPESRRLSTHGDAILVSARRFDGLGEAVADCGLVVLYTATLRALAPGVRELCAKLHGGLPNLWVPGERDFYEVAELPILGSGKLDLRRVAELAREIVGRVEGGG